jgi:hypothetical protein
MIASPLVRLFLRRYLCEANGDMAQFNPKTQQREPEQTAARGNISQLKLCLEAGIFITQNQPLEVVLTILPAELPDDRISQPGSAKNSYN